MFKPASLFDLKQTEHAALFDGVEFSWDVLKRIKDYVEANARPANLGKIEGNAFIGPNVFIGEGTVIEDGAMIKGPAIIGRNCQIRHNAYLREHVIIGDGCVVGNSCEFKNALLFNGCQVPHFNYVGDSILGHKAHLGAGVILSNFRSLAGSVKVQTANGPAIDTGLRKFGALVGDGADIGCNSVLNPGSVIGRGAMIYPGVNWRGYLPANHIAKNRAQTEVVAKWTKEG
ncbi:MAG TPA: DapH/DapD/GlmU-related protein [Candidatus Paceibacterota bacterium]|nr:DapH/DapD/GlmU-related protein [Candidatus Paceibacterota bacterium]